MQEVYEFLKKCGTYFLATEDGNKPNVRPFGTVDLFEGKLYIQTGKVKKVSEQMKRNPNVELCAFDGQRWIRVAAKAILDDNMAAREHMLNAYPELQSMYRADDGNTEVFYLKNATATIYSFTDSPKAITF